MASSVGPKITNSNVQISNLSANLPNWLIARSDIVDVTGIVSSPVAGAKIWKCTINYGSFANTLHRMSPSSNSDPYKVVGPLGKGNYWYTMYVRGETSNGPTAGASVDIADSNFLYPGSIGSTVLGSTTTWFKLLTNDLSISPNYNQTNFFDLSFGGKTGDIIYVSAPVIARSSGISYLDMVSLTTDPGFIPILSTTTESLNLLVDPRNSKSYPGSGSLVYDISGNSQVATLVNGATVSNNSMVFDGVNDSASIPNNSLLSFTGSTATFTVEILMRLNTYKDTAMICSKGDSLTISQNSYGFIGTSASLYFQVSDGSSTINSAALNTSSFLTGTWGHLVGVLDSTNLRLYLNGAEVGSSTVRSINSFSNSSPFYITSPTYSMNGSIALVRVYNYALAPSDVLANYNSIKTRS
jgi:hypothetical protein